MSLLNGFTASGRAMLIAAVVLGWAGCGGGEGDGGGGPPQVGSNSNWLRVCLVDDECGGLACLCGVCGSECASDADCSVFSDALCALEASPATRTLCGAGVSGTGLCMPRCEPGQCDASQACVDGSCIPLDIPDVPFCAPAEAAEAAARRLEDELLALVQTLREDGGDPCGATPASPAPSFRLDPRLTCVARVRALDIAAVGSANLLDSAGRTPEQRLAEATYAQTVWGESYAVDVTSAAQALQLMRADEGSCQRLSDAALVDVGVGVASGVAVVMIGAE